MGWGHRVIFDVFRPRIMKENITMAVDQSVLSELLDALRAGGDCVWYGRIEP